MLSYKRSLNIAGGNSLRHSASRGSLRPVSNFSASSNGAFIDSFCSPSDFKLTFDYYAFFHATAKIDLRSVLISHRERNRECVFRLEWRKELHHSYAGELRVLTPFNQRREHFVEDYNPGHERRAGKMSSRNIRRPAELHRWVRDESRHIECRRCDSPPTDHVRTKTCPSFRTSNRLPRGTR